jgi:hypothetical protein
MMTIDEDEEEDALIREMASPLDQNPFSEDEKKTKRKWRGASQKKIEIDQTNELSWWKSALATDVGRRIMWGLLQETGAFQDNFGCSPNGSPDQQATWFNAGKKAFGLHLYHKMMEMEMQSIFFMHKENDPRFIK